MSAGLDNEYNVMAISVNVMVFIKSFTNIPDVFLALILAGIFKWCTGNSVVKKFHFIIKIKMTLCK